MSLAKVAELWSNKANWCEKGAVSRGHMLWIKCEWLLRNTLLLFWRGRGLTRVGVTTLLAEWVKRFGSASRECGDSGCPLRLAVLSESTRGPYEQLSPRNR